MPANKTTLPKSDFKRRRMLSKPERAYLESIFREHPSYWSAARTEQLSIKLGISRKKIT